VVPQNKGGHKLKIRSAVKAWASQPTATPYGQAPAAAVPAVATGGGWAPSAPAPYSPPVAVAVQSQAAGGWGSPAPAPYASPPAAVMQAVVVDSPAGVGSPVAATVVGATTGSVPGQVSPPYNAQLQPQAGICTQCGARPVFTEPQTGRQHQYCGKRCAGDARAGRPPAAAAGGAGSAASGQQLGMPPGGMAPVPYYHQQQQPQRQTPMCVACGVNPANPPHPYCGRRCAAARSAGGAAGAPVPAAVAAAVGVPSASAMHPTADPGMCSFCNKRPAVQGHPFCGRGCAGTATQAGWVNGKPPGPAAYFAKLEPELIQVGSAG
jgi:hypothetical protein